MKIYTLNLEEDAGFTKSEESQIDAFIKTRAHEYYCCDDSGQAYDRTDEELYSRATTQRFHQLLGQARKLEGRQRQRAIEDASDFYMAELEELAVRWANRDAAAGEWKE